MFNSETVSFVIMFLLIAIFSLQANEAYVRHKANTISEQEYREASLLYLRDIRDVLLP